MEFPFLNKTKKTSGLCCIYLMPDSINLAHVTYLPNSQLHLQAVTTKPYTDVGSLKVGLEELVAQYELEGVKCCWVLNPDSYQLMLLDKPAVEANEIIPALRWQLKKVISYPPDEALITYFDLHLFNKTDAKEEIYVSIARRDPLQKTADLIYNSGLKLEFIDISELALRNFNARFGDNDEYLGLLLLKPAGSTLIITHRQELLLNRSIPLSLDLTEEVALEIQRSFVFCQNQQQQAKPKKLLIAPENAELANYLSSQLEIEAQVLAMNTFFNNSDSLIDNLTHDQIIAVGGALRLEDQN